MEDFVEKYKRCLSRYTEEYDEVPGAGAVVFRAGSLELKVLPGFMEEDELYDAMDCFGGSVVREVPTRNRELFFVVKINFEGAIVRVRGDLSESICRVILSTVKDVVAAGTRFKLAAYFSEGKIDEWYCKGCDVPCTQSSRPETVRCARCLRDYGLWRYCTICDRKSPGACTGCGSSSSHRQIVPELDTCLSRILSSSASICMRFAGIVVTPNAQAKFYAAASDAVREKLGCFVRGVRVDWDAAFSPNAIKVGPPLMAQAHVCFDETGNSFKYHPSKFRIRTARRPSPGISLDGLRRMVCADPEQQKKCVGGHDVTDDGDVLEEARLMLREVDPEIRITRMYVLQSKVLLVFTNPTVCPITGERHCNGCFRFMGKKKAVYHECTTCKKSRKLGAFPPDKVNNLISKARGKPASNASGRMPPRPSKRARAMFPFGSVQEYYKKLLNLVDDLDTFIRK